MNKILSVILPALVALAFGCGKSETHQSPDGKIRVEQNGDTAKVEVVTKDGKATVTTSDKGVAIPDTFPKDVPIPKGAVPKLTMSQGKAEFTMEFAKYEAVPKMISEELQKKYGGAKRLGSDE